MRFKGNDMSFSYKKIIKFLIFFSKKNLGFASIGINKDRPITEMVSA